MLSVPAKMRRVPASHSHGPDPAPRALADITAVVYEELRSLARRHLSNERPDHTLQTTALAHEALLRLHGDREARNADKDQFLTLAARAIRRVLVDHARGRSRLKRGGAAFRVPFDENQHAAAFDVVTVSHLLDDLATVDATQARVVELRVFGGLTFAQIAKTLRISQGTAHSEWRMARAWLLDRLEPVP